MSITESEPPRSYGSTLLPSGYKKTAIGILPNDWNLVELSKLAVILFSNVDKHIIEDEKKVLLCNYKDVYSNRYIFSGIKFSNGSVNENEYNKFLIKKGDVIITKDSEDSRDIAVPSYVLEDIKDLVCGYHLAIIRPQGNKLNGMYLSQLLQSYNINHVFQRLANGITRFGLNTDSVKKSMIPVPDINEQKKIAEILLNWDEAISSCSALVKVLKERNKGLSQQLLTCKKRLSGFSDKWVTKKIKDFSIEVSSKNKEDEDLMVLSCTKHNGLVPSLEYFGRKIYSDNLKTYKIVEKNVFAYATNHIEEGSIGYQSKYDKALISPMYTVFKTEENINDEFLFRVLKSNTYIQEYQKRMEGSIDRRGGLRWQEFSKIKVSVPSYEEQTAIALALETADQELKSYETKLEALQLQKKGLIQQLLTGKIRVNVK